MNTSDIQLLLHKLFCINVLNCFHTRTMIGMSRAEHIYL